ncbi:hypothetical protein HELRODRAFT_186189 [Helobdella robusta]|uniref:Growth hormone-inducible transmembrane protein n=1 Tax=Helobdella robusta TaxID=6412 RepID=T1FNS5_HELRO|nr:hypothetical protein HELRODRAFT_186189 [Helobdella robusta]ESN91163.1 hypothetical protein HELRODRAFT_186189 [Helobdella robusta]
MFACRFAITRLPMVSMATKSGLVTKVRLFAQESKSSALRRVKEVTKGPTLKERLMAPAGDTAFTAGRGLLAGASLLGLGGLCYYGLGLSDQVGAIDRAALWPATVKERIRNTYAYFGGSLIFTAASAVLLSRSPTFMNVMFRSSWMTLIGSMVAMMGTGILCQSLPYTESIGVKHLAWMLHSCVVGAVVAPIALMGGPLLVRAACYTVGVVGGLSALAMCAPSDKFLYMGGPLAMGLGVVFISSIGTWFLPPSTALGAGLYSIAVYGGLALFGAFLLYDTQKVVYRAEHHVAYADQPFDPINNSVGIFMDTINIFIRIAMILSGSSNRRK